MKEFEFLVNGEQHAISRHVVIDILPYALTTSLKSECSYGKRRQYRHVDAEETPSKKSRKEGTQGSVAIPEAQ